MKRRDILKGLLGSLVVAPVAACARLVPCEKVVPVIEEPNRPIFNGLKAIIAEDDVLERMKEAWSRYARQTKGPTYICVPSNRSEEVGWWG